MTEKEKIHIDIISEKVSKIFSNESSGHDEFHIERVKNMAMFLAKENSANEYICALAALLHEHDDSKFTNLTGGKIVAQKLLQNLKLESKNIEHIMDIISTLSFKGSTEIIPMKTIEGMCVQDADRLDAMGAIGIARTFSFSGAKGRKIYQPNTNPQTYSCLEDYHNSDSSAIAHFYEKLLLLKDRMNTKQAKKIAEERHNFMLQYLKQFYKEWEGK